MGEQKEGVEDAKESFADTLYTIMQEENMTYLEIAGLLEVDPSTITRWVGGGHIPLAGEIVRVARKLGVSPRRFLPDE